MIKILNGTICGVLPSFIQISNDIFKKCPLFALGYDSDIIGKFGNFIKFYGKIPDILVLITGLFGLFKTPTLRLREAGTIQTQSQT